MERQHNLHSSIHGSFRSKDSSSTVESDPREKIKDCLRKFIAFMFTQVGVGALVVCYAILGAASFMHIEKDSPDEQLENVIQWRQNCVEQLWNITNKYNVLNYTAWMSNSNKVLKDFQNNVTSAIHLGYNGRSSEDIWSFPAALMYSLSVFTMIGYGNVVPKTVWGKIVTIAYACFGIPIYVLYFCNMGKVLAKTFKWLYITAHECSRREDPLLEDGEIQPIKKKITVPSTACLWVISFYILTGTIMFGAWEKWNYLDSTYFCVISLCKIGFGDFVPGANIADSAEGSHLKLVINFIYVLLGMGLVAMCYNLMCEDVRVKVRELREDLKNCLDDITLKITVCMNDTKYYHQRQTRNIK
ncbi:TWiK family of potassium channels protein 7 [Vanessa tameamea]|uniref:TWiK family of potassium channels protein 7 n=1 Tax=Vanessa tameamea TaxID=334116 RepID=A0A8B8IMV9_VANTA|nr:TWiK family of potassium channels protein 7 [Vanessa tameamea]XP_047531473.1 TWiK family of potassium channels protein 7 [Vanessa atalanta]